MYTAFYGLREKPFALSPDPRFLYLAGSHREALAHLLYGIEQGEGFISVTGEVGTGKTTLCRTLLERLEGDLELAFLFNPSRTALELLQSICAEFDLPAEGLTRRSLMSQLNTFLVEQKSNGRRVLLIIDEAQTLSDNTLEQVRLLSNLETSREKLIQILLLGQPELDRKLDGRGLRQLRQRISVRWKLEPLSAPETRAYVRHRLSIAAGEPKDLFTDAALREVHRRTGGIPRLINQLCDRALLGGYASRAARIDPSLVRAAAREIPDAGHPRARSGERSTRSGPSFLRPWMYFAVTLALVVAALYGGLQAGRLGLTDSMRASVFKRPAIASRNGVDSGVLETARPDDAPPAVGANASTAGASGTTGTDGLSRADGSPDLGDAPTLGRLIGYIPDELREGLSATPGQLADTPKPGGLVHARASLEIPPRLDGSTTAIAPGLFPRLLTDRSANAVMAASQRAMLERFGRLAPSGEPNPSDPEALRKNIESRGLTATPFDGGSLDLIRRLEHPVLMPLVAYRESLPSRGVSPAMAVPESEHRWLAITGFDGERARVAGLVSDRLVTVPVAELEAHWLETGIIVWEQFEAVPPLLAEGASGPSVQWLQRALAELQFFEGRPTGDFDPDTRTAVADFQRERGLLADGVAGPLTQIALYGQLDRYPVPRLSQADFGTTSSPGSLAPSQSPSQPPRSSPSPSASPASSSPPQSPSASLSRSPRSPQVDDPRTTEPRAEAPRQSGDHG